MSILCKLLPDAPQPVRVVEATKEGLRLSNGWMLEWPDEDCGVIFLCDQNENLFFECWPGELHYNELIELFKRWPSKHEVVNRPTLRVIGFDEHEE